VTEQSRAETLNRESSIKRFDYQKKRIERYIKSKSSLSVKDIADANNKYKNGRDGKNIVDISKQAEKLG
jgi:hypothetical protein